MSDQTCQLKVSDANVSSKHQTKMTEQKSADMSITSVREHCQQNESYAFWQRLLFCVFPEADFRYTTTLLTKTFVNMHSPCIFTIVLSHIPLQSDATKIPMFLYSHPQNWNNHYKIKQERSFFVFSHGSSIQWKRYYQYSAFCNDLSGFWASARSKRLF